MAHSRSRFWLPAILVVVSALLMRQLLIRVVSTSLEDARFRVSVTAVDRVDPAFFFQGTQVLSTGLRGGGVVRAAPARRTHLRINARPDDAGTATETRSLTVLALAPVPYVASEPSDVVVSWPADEDFDWDTVAFLDTGGDVEWTFEFDLSQAPSFLAPSVRRLSTDRVRAEFPYADTLQWNFGRLTLDDGTRVAYCFVEEPIHVTATDGERVLRRTIISDLKAEAALLDFTPDCLQPPADRD